MPQANSILIIEDDRQYLNMLEQTFLEQHFNVYTASDGNMGLQKALTQHPDIILMDIMIPGSNGIMILKKIREDAWGKKVPVLLLTNISSNDDEVLLKVAESEPSFYMEKSQWTLNGIVERVKETLKPSS